ncbi:MAG TPA: translation elongation factor Ts [Anaerolineae bacterium]
MEISATMVKELRQATGAGVLDCRKALESSSGDFEKAVEVLREKGLSVAAKKASREANEGLIGNFITPDSQVAALVEVNCETDFVARTSDFVQFTQDVARQVAEQGAGLADVDALTAQPLATGDGRSIRETLTAMIGKLGENMVVRRFARLAVDPAGRPGSISTYVHMGSKVASLVEVTCDAAATARGSEQLATLGKDLAMQVVAARPQWLSREDVPADIIAKEKEIYRAQLGDTNKPPQVIERILEGKLGKFYEENCLLDQQFIRDDSKCIKDVVAETSKLVGEKVVVERFARLEVGG